MGQRHFSHDRQKRENTYTHTHIPHTHAVKGIKALFCVWSVWKRIKPAGAGLGREAVREERGKA